MSTVPKATAQLLSKSNDRAMWEVRFADGRHYTACTNVIGRGLIVRSVPTGRKSWGVNVHAACKAAIEAAQ